MSVEKVDLLDQIKKRNRKARLLTALVVVTFVSLVLLTRYFFLSKGLNFGDVNGASTQAESSLTKINFIDSGSVRSSVNTFGDIKSQFTPDFPNKFWVKFNQGDKTLIGYLDLDLKFNKIYELPSNVKLVKLLDDESILFTDEPLKEQPSLYYQHSGGDIIKFSSLDFQDTYLSILYNPSEKLIYYLGKDNANTFFLYSVNEKGKESVLYKTGDFTEKVRIVSVDDNNIYFLDNQICYQLNFANKNSTQLGCETIVKNDLQINYAVNPQIQTLYTQAATGEIQEVNKDSTRRNLFTLQTDQIVSKFSYSNNKIIFARAALNPISENAFVGKDLSVNLLDLSNNQSTEITQKLPNEVVSNYFTFGDKFLAVAGNPSSKLLYFVQAGMQGQVYIGDVSPISFATVTKYWLDVDFGGSSSSLSVLNGDFTL